MKCCLRVGAVRRLGRPAGAVCVARACFLPLRVLDRLPHLPRRGWHVYVRYPVGRERVHDRVYDRGRCPDGPRLADTLHAHLVRGGRRDRPLQGVVRELGRTRDQVVNHRARRQVTVLVVDGFFVEGLGYALRYSTVQLTVDDGRVDDGSAVVDTEVVPDLHEPGLRIHLGDADVRPEREGEVGRVEEELLGEYGLHTLGQVVRQVCGPCHVGHGYVLVGRAGDTESTAFKLYIVLGSLEHVGRDLLGLLDDLLGRHVDRDTADREAPRTIRVTPIRGYRRVAVQDLHVIRRDAKDIRGDLGPARHVSLSVGRCARDDLDITRGEHLDLRHLPAGPSGPEGREHLRGGEAADLGVGGESDAELYGVARLAPLALFLSQPLVVGQLEHPVERHLVVAGVVLYSGRRIRRLVEGFVEVAAAHLGGVEPYLGGEGVHDALDGEGGLGPTSAAVGVGGCLVGVDAGTLERVCGEGVDARVHKRAEQRYTGRVQVQICAHVGE